MALLTKRKVVTFLKEKGGYDNIDEVLVDEIIANIETMQDCKVELKDKGLIIKNNGGKTIQKNPALQIYNDCMTNVLNLSKKLGLFLKDRVDIGLQKEGGDEFDL